MKCRPRFLVFKIPANPLIRRGRVDGKVDVWVTGSYRLSSNDDSTKSFLKCRPFVSDLYKVFEPVSTDVLG